MSLASPEPRPQGLTLANIPAWVMLCVVLGSPIFAGFVTSAVGAQKTEALAARQDADEVWKAAMERRVAEQEKAAAVSNMETRKDLEQVKSGIQALQSALMVRTPPVATPTP